MAEAAPPPLTARLFLSIAPSPELVRLLQTLSRPAEDWIRWTTPEQWHVTLRFFGRTPVADIPDLIAALEAAGVAACAATAGPAVERLGSQVLCVPVTGMEPLAAAVAAATADFGEPPERRRFRGHLTVARARGRHRFGAGHEGAPVAATWEVRSFELMRSHTDLSGARYEQLASFSLG